MAVNLTPQYHQAEDEYRRAQTAEERLEALQKMWREVPKHKASEKLQAELKQKLSLAKKECDREKQTSKKAGVSYKIPKQGAGQVVVLGAPNAGKSQLLCKFTKAHPAVAPFPFTTHEPHAGMMDWEDTHVQLVDTPPITPDYLESYVSSLVRAADAALLLVDLSDDDGPFAAEAIIEKLADVKTVLTGKPPAEHTDPSIHYTRTILGANKLDADGAQDRLAIVKEMFGERFPVYAFSAEHGQGMEELRQALYKWLNIIRVYAKAPGKPADMKAPFTLPVGSTVLQFAERVHKDFAEHLKSARIWGTGVFDGQSVGREHVLFDKDIVELHAAH
jgi:ribosome-interacting GTPase 1